MKSIAKILLVGAVAMMAIAVSAAPSEAAKKKKKGPGKGTFYGQLCSTSCNASKVCKVMVWGYGNKWHPTLLTPACLQPTCPAAC